MFSHITQQWQLHKKCLLETNWSVIKFHWLLLLNQWSFIKDDWRFTVSWLYKFCDYHLSFVPWFQRVFGSAGRFYSLFWWLTSSGFFHTKYVWTTDVLVSSQWICWITILLHIPGDLTFLGSYLRINRLWILATFSCWRLHYFTKYYYNSSRASVRISAGSRAGSFKTLSMYILCNTVAYENTWVAIEIA